MNPTNRNPFTDFEARAANRSLEVGVIGMGYVGLPLATVFAEAGFHVTGFDISAAKVRSINDGKSYIEDVPSEKISDLVRKGRLNATTGFSALSRLDTVSICVPTPLSKTQGPDMTFIVSATEQIARYLRPGQVIVLESTTYPGSTREVVLPILEETGLRVGEDFNLAFSPERVDPGRSDWTTTNTPKVIGGITDACLERASVVYGAAIETVIPMTSPEAAEMVKLLENTFRAVNIGLANEVLLMCDVLDLDVWEVVDAAATKPFGFMKFTPGPGLGGHCIPIDPHYLSWKLRTLNYNARFIELASEVNSRMPAHWVQRVQDALNDAGKALRGSEVLVLGVAYKKDVSDLRESPALEIIRLLEAKGGIVRYHDPHVPAFVHADREWSSVVDLDPALESADCVVVATDHSFYDPLHVRGLAGLLINTRSSSWERRAAVEMRPNGRNGNGLTEQSTNGQHRTSSRIPDSSR